MSKCEDCVYYFEDTNYCLHSMYDAKPCEDCGKRDKNNYSHTTSILHPDFEFSPEVTDYGTYDVSIGELFSELSLLHEELEL